MEQLPQPLPDNPLLILKQWLDDAGNDGGFPNPDAMALATVDSNGQPGNRIVLCKRVVADPGYVVFYTNYQSAKAGALDHNPAVAAVFHWDHLNRQARIEGHAVMSPAQESDDYFASRDRDSKLGAWASAQSQSLQEREQLLRAMQAIDTRFPRGAAVPRPPHWGGYRIWLSAVELWVRGQARLHDRGRWERELGQPSADGRFQPGPWHSSRLQP